MTYLVIYEKTATGYSAYVPDLPGCITTGRTREETVRLIQEAIDFHIEGLREDGLPIPEPATAAGYVEASARPAA
jgi:predicted RNase H-like HicB family nuclease